jgi:hypothetical protein
VGRPCGTHGRGKCTEFWWESPKETDHSEDQCVDGMIESEWTIGRLAWRWCGLDSTGPVTSTQTTRSPRTTCEGLGSVLSFSARGHTVEIRIHLGV